MPQIQNEPNSRFYDIVIVPAKAAIPEGIDLKVVTEGDIITKIAQASDGACIMPVMTRELQMLIEYRDLIPMRLRAVVGLKGSMFSTLWATYTSTVDRVTVEQLKAESKDARDERSVEGQRPLATPNARAKALVRAADHLANSIADQTDEDDDDGSDEVI